MSFSLVLVPVVATVAGGVVAALRPPTPRLVASAQHVAAGAVIAAVSAELVFKLVAAQALGGLLVGFTAGTVAVLALRWWTSRLQRRSQGGARGSVGLVAAVGADVFVDGTVIGIGLEAGGSSGLLLVIALTLELVFLGASVAGELPPRRAVVIAVTAGLAALLPAGAALGRVLGGLRGFALDTVLAFAAAVLLFLVTEELLREAHEREDSLINTALLFGAFLAIVALDIVA